MPTSFRFATDTSTLCMFDVASLRHRIEEEADWWVYPPSVQVDEINSASAAFVDLGSDGTFAGTPVEEQLADPALQIVEGVALVERVVNQPMINSLLLTFGMSTLMMGVALNLWTSNFRSVVYSPLTGSC